MQKGDDEWWLTSAYLYHLISSQRVLNGGQNCRHGSTYLTLSKDAAIRYAKSNPAGSEAIIYTLNLFIEAGSRYPELVQGMNSDCDPVLAFFGDRHQDRYR